LYDGDNVYPQPSRINEVPSSILANDKISSKTLQTHDPLSYPRLGRFFTGWLAGLYSRHGVLKGSDRKQNGN